jgi:O-antigen ligase
MSDELHNLKKPGTAVAVLLCAIPAIATLAFGAVEYWATGLLGILALVLVLAWLETSRRSGRFCFSASSLQIPVLGLILIGFVQLLPLGSSGIGPGTLDVPVRDTLSLDPYATTFFLIRANVLFIFFAAALAFIDSRKRLTRIAGNIVVFGAVRAFFAIMQRLASADAIYGVRHTPHAIPFGTYVNQHHFAALLEMMSGVTLGMLFGHAVNRDRKFLLAFAAVVMGMAIIFTGSRGGLISYLGVVVFAALGSFLNGRVHSHHHASDAQDARSAQQKLLIIGSGAALVLIVLGSAFFLGGGEGLFRGIGDQADMDVTSGRAHFWAIALKIFLANPIIGAGFDAFGVAFTRFDTWPGLLRVEQAHNDYLQILADAGILGFACVAVFIYLFFRRSSAVITGAHDDMSRSIAIGAVAGCVGILIHSFFDFPLRTTSNAFFFFLLVAMATNIVASPGHHHRRRRHSIER